MYFRIQNGFSRIFLQRVFKRWHVRREAYGTCSLLFKFSFQNICFQELIGECVETIFLKYSYWGRKSFVHDSISSYIKFLRNVCYIHDFRFISIHFCSWIIFSDKILCLVYYSYDGWFSCHYCDNYSSHFLSHPIRFVILYNVIMSSRPGKIRHSSLWSLLMYFMLECFDCCISCLHIFQTFKLLIEPCARIYL